MVKLMGIAMMILMMFKINFRLFLAKYNKQCFQTVLGAACNNAKDF